MMVNTAQRNILIAAAVGIAIGSYLEFLYSQRYCRCDACNMSRATEEMIRNYRNGTTTPVVGNGGVHFQYPLPNMGDIQSVPTMDKRPSGEATPFVRPAGIRSEPDSAEASQ